MKNLCILTCSCLLFVSSAFADWDQGDPHKMHFPQLPNPEGWDICLHEQFVADDFQCTETGPIRDIHFWVSWQGDIEEFANTQFTVQIRQNLLGGPCGGGRPGNVLWTWSSTGGIGNFVIRHPPYSGQQGWHCPSTGLTQRPDHLLYWQINITDIPDDMAFHQDQGQVYWLVIRANKMDWPPAVGWKTSLNRFMSCSLWSTNGTTWNPVTVDGGVDQAFVITNDEEMNTLDFGDAPDQPYPTLLARNGARHIIRPIGPWLGDPLDNPDPEADGQPTLNADGDDLNGYDDEDGVTIPVLTINQSATITFQVSSGDGGGGTVTGWIDFNGSGIWGDFAAEQIVNATYVDGIYSVPITPPPGTIIGTTYARFRISRDIAGTVPTGLAQDGEVEDYLVIIQKEPEPDQFDFGDAPEGGIAYPATGILGQFPTCMTVGPSAWIQHTNFGAFFGPVVDFELDGNAGSCPGCFPPYDLDECFQDGDAGLMIPASFTISGGIVVPCMGASGPSLGMTCQNAFWGPNIDVMVTNNMPSNAVGFVNVLIDWDQNGIWAGGSICPIGPAPEHVLVDFPVPNGFNGPLSALLPPPFIIGPNADYVWARITITERQVGPGWSGDGTFEDGETEDYLLHVLPGIPPEDRDFGDAPDQPYPTLLANNGAYHVIVPSVYMGAAIDAETDGQPTLPADGDDVNPLVGPDDEDGVVFLTAPLVAGFPAQVQITASVNGFIDAWIDFEKNGDWANPLEQIFASQPVSAGVNTLTFNVPTGLGGGVSSPVSYARFRFSTAGGLSYVGPAGDGEVEDYHVLIEGEIENAADLGDAPDSTNNMLTAMTAYTGVQANFPTVYIDGSGTTPQGPIHLQSRNVAYLGDWATLEVEADGGPDEDLVNNIDPISDIPDLDNSDDGVFNMPLHLPYCDYTTFDYKITVAPSAAYQVLYVNAWFDWNRDGDWDDVLSPVCSNRQVDEWAVQNQVFTVVGPGQYTITTPGFLSWHPILTGGIEETWMRITLSEQPWTPTAGTLGDGGSGPAGGYQVGETEDYLFVPDTSCVRCADLNCDGTVNLSDFAIFASRWLATCP